MNIAETIYQHVKSMPMAKAIEAKLPVWSKTEYREPWHELNARLKWPLKRMNKRRWFILMIKPENNDANAKLKYRS